MKVKKKKYHYGLKGYSKRADGDILKTIRCDYCRNQACYYYRPSSLFKRANSESCANFF